MRGEGRAWAADGLISSIKCTNVSLHRSDSAATDGVHNAIGLLHAIGLIRQCGNRRRAQRGVLLAAAPDAAALPRHGDPWRLVTCLRGVAAWCMHGCMQT